MTIKQLKEFVNNLPDNMEIIQTMCSDFKSLELTDITTITVVKKQMRHWSGRLVDPICWDYMSVYPNQISSMNEQDRNNIITVLHIDGN